MNIKYYLGFIPAVLLLPLLYFEGKRIRKKVPVLPEAKNPSGHFKGDYHQNLNIIFIGESTLAGVGVDYHEEGFAGSFARTIGGMLEANVSWRVYAKSGYTVKKMREKLVPKIEEKEIDLIICGIGGNDAFTLNRPNKWKKEVIELIDELTQNFSSTPIAFTNMPPIKSFPAFSVSVKWVIGNLVEILGEELERIVRKFDHVHYNSEIISLENWSQLLEDGNDSSAFFSDGVHPSQLTYQIWAQNFFQFICDKKILEPKNQ